MRAQDFAEQGTIGSTALPAAGGSTVPPTSNPAITGNVAQLQDPKFAAATLAKQQQDKQAMKNQIMKQITDLQKQITALRTQQASIK